MKAFTIYKKNIKEEASYDNTVFVAEDFSFLSFFLLFFYTLYKKCYFLSAIIMFIFLVIEFIYYIDLINVVTYLLMNLILRIYSGCAFYEWYQGKLQKNGCTIYDIIYAHSMIKAQIKFFNK